MKQLVIEIDLDKLPDGVTVPNELGVILDEARQQLEKLEDIKAVSTWWRLYNFESQHVGFVRIIIY
jgi:hypothetical protein